MKGEPRQHAAKRARPETVAQYRRRFGELWRGAVKELGQPFSFSAFVEWIGAKCEAWSASTWRFNRASLRQGLADKRLADPAVAPDIDDALLQISLLRAGAKRGRILRTSQQKSKRLPESDLSRIRNAALAGRSPKRELLVDLLSASAVTGVRPTEWPSACLSRSKLPGFDWELTVMNAKFDEVRGPEARAHGEFRTLRWVRLDPTTVAIIQRWIGIARVTELTGDYDYLLRALRDLMYNLTTSLFPHRRQRPGLYSGRHEAIAAWKAHYVGCKTTEAERLEGLAIVAALSGHASDETASTHYGRRRRGERPVDLIAVADRAEVARVRRRMQASLQHLADLKTIAPTPRL